MSSAKQEPDVTDITIDRAAMTMQLTFDDGASGTIGLMELRLNCPCATCRAARQVGKDVWPPAKGDQTLALKSANLVGAWGLGVTWVDGHATGIYPFEDLHSWILDGQPSFNPDSGLGE